MPISTGNPFWARNVFSTKSGVSKAGVAFLNLEFKPQPAFISSRDEDFKQHNKALLHGPGLYCLCFTDTPNENLDVSNWSPIYIGSFLGQGSNLFGGNVADLRWWKHLATITMRGNDVSIGTSALRTLPRTHPLVKGLGLGVPKIHQPHNCVSSVNRAKFAIKYWNLFEPVPSPNGNGPSDLLEHFKFIYLRFDKALFPQASPLIHCLIRDYIETAERALIDIIRPCCNGIKPKIKDQKLYDTIKDEFENKQVYDCDDASKALASVMNIVETRVQADSSGRSVSSDQVKQASVPDNPTEEASDASENKIRLVNTTTRLPADRALETVLRRIIDPDLSKAIGNLIQRRPFRDTGDQAIDIYLVNRLDNIREKSSATTPDDDVERLREYSEGSGENMPDTDVLGRYFSHHPSFHEPVIEVCPEKMMKAARRLHTIMARKTRISEIYPALFCMVVTHELGHALMDGDQAPSHHMPWAWLADLFDDGDSKRFDGYLNDLTKPTTNCHECHRHGRQLPSDLDRMVHIIEESLANAIAIKQRYTNLQKKIIEEFMSRQSKPYRAGLKWKLALPKLLKTAEAWGQFKEKLRRVPPSYDDSKDCSASPCLMHRLIDDNLPPETKPISTKTFEAEFKVHLDE